MQWVTLDLVPLDTTCPAWTLPAHRQPGHSTAHSFKAAARMSERPKAVPVQAHLGPWGPQTQPDTALEGGL